MKVKTYDEDDLRSTDYRRFDSPKLKHKWEFIGDLPGDNPDLFGDWDNYEMTERLREIGALTKDDDADPEYCCSYFYFKDKKTGRRFIKKLNEYLLKKAKLIEEARSF